MEETIFWRRMNPARLHALFDAWFDVSSQAAPEHAAPPEKPKEKKSLYEYLTGG